MDGVQNLHWEMVINPQKGISVVLVFFSPPEVLVGKSEEESMGP